jgi:hypothetical protein
MQAKKVNAMYATEVIIRHAAMAWLTGHKGRTFWCGLLPIKLSVMAVTMTVAMPDPDPVTIAPDLVAMTMVVPIVVATANCNDDATAMMAMPCVSGASGQSDGHDTSDCCCDQRRLKHAFLHRAELPGRGKDLRSLHYG